MEGHQAWVRALAFSPDSSLIASAGDDGAVRLWNTDGQVWLKPLRGHDGSASAITFTEDGTGIVTGGYFDGKIRHWTITETP